ncbi:MAG: gluconate 2-dehydrogenase subunit 3 family protein, partial [Paraglaciecola sp.]|nr:gluconate 2-dehydrogenase subunit 3 family protein [Paraglaciecola sp.]
HILPKTNTLSAGEVGCHEFVRHKLQHCHTTQQKNNCIDIINKIDQLAEKSAAKSFALIPKAQQRQLLEDIENNIGLDNEEQGQFMFLKALIVFGYFTSEIGASQALSYQAVPGGFIGSIAANSATKSWGSLAYY